MPFPNKEIERAYEESLSIAQGCFKDDPEVLEIDDLAQKHYTLIMKRVDEDTLRLVNGLTGLLHEMQEYQCQHGFTEGWLAARKKLP